MLIYMRRDTADELIEYAARSKNLRARAFEIYDRFVYVFLVVNSHSDKDIKVLNKRNKLAVVIRSTLLCLGAFRLRFIEYKTTTRSVLPAVAL